MAAIGGILALVASLGMLVFGIQILIKAFQQSIWWGLGYLFVPFVGLFYIVMFWDDAKKPLPLLAGLRSRSNDRHGLGGSF